MPPPFRVELLAASHDRESFSCGQDALDPYLHTQATQDVRRRVATCFVAVEAESGQVAAYYTLASTGIPINDLPPDIVKKLPRYPSIPAVRIGRLAVGLKFQGRGLGSALLADALSRVLVAPPAAWALVVDAKDDSAAAFYRRHGFVPFVDRPHSLFLPIATAGKLLPVSSD